MSPERLEELKDDIAILQSMLDQAQAHFDKHRHLWDEAIAWEMQAKIDVKQFDLEMAKLAVKIFDK